MPSTRGLATRLPDLPRWVEVRDLLLSDECEVTALQEQPELSFVLREPAIASASHDGCPTIPAAQLPLPLVNHPIPCKT